MQYARGIDTVGDVTIGWYPTRLEPIQSVSAATLPILQLSEPVFMEPGPLEVASQLSQFAERSGHTR